MRARARGTLIKAIGGSVRVAYAIQEASKHSMGINTVSMSGGRRWDDP